MMILAMALVTIWTIITLMTLALNLISKKKAQDREKMAPFECGFDPKSSPRLPFSLQFFLIATIFLVFDVEITLLFPIIKSMETTSMSDISSITAMFITILIAGTVHEWRSGALSWKS
uniref:NADH-ubiquinone oxidoreductase chain 3 n=1 Tax=Melittomma sp. MEL01 TaxID=1205634 RepID=A0A0S2MPP6_9CUCU|nr:NADH deshydrogenase subunit 3 [Melittomma sp. MEL01]